LGYANHVVHSGASGCETSTHYVSFSGGTGMDITKSTLEHVTPKLCFCILWYLWVM
jgi:hypothetical protein